ncbi:hypothetical protein QFZ52_000883 [Arthrobacter woluwensis]|uniref:hypothetical protein n=1 Tax=Arthrobacter woluwensis TaxID=156980 RepID=UPI002786AF04|nr:hypothetical protein [Arthrobacter woluwensis]MDQ0708231.1 hypothetical protein [Arthrobacter woluwensis]
MRKPLFAMLSVALSALLVNGCAVTVPSPGKAWSESELEEVVGRLKGPNDGTFTQVAADTMRKTVEVRERLQSRTSVDPPACQEVAVSENRLSTRLLDRGRVALGLNESGRDAKVSVVLSSGPQELLHPGFDGETLERCSTLKLIRGVPVATVSVAKAEAPKVEGGLAWTVTTVGSSGTVETSMSTVTVGRVNIFVSVSGQKGGADTAAVANAVVEQAAALVD